MVWYLLMINLLLRTRVALSTQSQISDREIITLCSLFQTKQLHLPAVYISASSSGLFVYCTLVGGEAREWEGLKGEGFIWWI